MGRYNKATLEFMYSAPTATIQDQIARSTYIIGTKLDEARIYGTCVTCSISGGSDSDILMDFVSHFDLDNEVKYVFFDTGIEMKATKEHLDYLEERYGTKIERVRAKVPVAAGCRKFGVPFMSKTVSTYMYRLQSHGFQWEDGSYEDLITKYPRCQAALKWWCNAWPKKPGKTRSRFDIANNLLLKEFIMENHPDFKISAKCCDGAKKDTAEMVAALYSPSLNITGIRQAEGGAKSDIGPYLLRPQ